MALPPVAVPMAVPVLRLPVDRDLDGPPKLPKVLVLAQRFLHSQRARAAAAHRHNAQLVGMQFE